MCGGGGYTAFTIAVCLSVRLSVEKWFLRDNSTFFWRTMMILFTCIVHDPRRTSIDFGVQRSTIFGLRTFYRFRMVTPFPFGIHWWYMYFTHELTMTRGGPLLIFVSKDQRSRSYLDFELFTISAQLLYFLLAYNDDTSHTYWPWPKKYLIWFWGQRLRSYLDLQLFFISQIGPPIDFGSRG